MREFREPTGDECESNAVIDLGDGVLGRAIWYPQMGGYVGKAIAVQEGDCWGLYIWHDGAFPFTADGDGREPYYIHHCMAEQFVEFGNKLLEFEGVERNKLVQNPEGDKSEQG